MNPARRSLCIVSRDPLQCSELVLSLQSLLDPDDEVDATGRVVSRAKGLIDRVKSEAIGNTPVSAGPEPSGDEDPVTVKPRPAQSP